MIDPADLELTLQRHQSNKVHPSLRRLNYREAAPGTSQLISHKSEPKEEGGHPGSLAGSLLISHRSPRERPREVPGQNKPASKSELQLDIPKLTVFFKYNQKTPAISSNRKRNRRAELRQSQIGESSNPQTAPAHGQGKENTLLRLSGRGRGTTDKRGLNQRRAEINLQELHKKLSDYHMSKAGDRSAKNADRLNLPEISTPALVWQRSTAISRADPTGPGQIGDKAPRSEAQSSPRPAILDSRRAGQSSEEEASGPWVYVNGRQPELLTVRRRMEKSPRGRSRLFGLSSSLARRESESARPRDKVFIYSFLEKGVPLPIPSGKDIGELKERIDQNFEKNLHSVQKYGSKICLRARDNIKRMIESNKKAQHGYCIELLLKMKDFLLFFKTLRLSPRVILKFPIRPYQNPRAQEFIEAAKFGDIDRLKDLLYRVSDLLIFEFDHLHLTALHWAAKRNHVRCAEDLISMRSYVNARDIYGRSPLYYAIKNKAETLVYKLLVYRASPWSPKGYNYIELAEGDENIIYYVRRFRFLEIILSLHKIHERERIRRKFIEKKIRVPKFVHLDLSQAGK